jgi:hypothetical protein
MNFDKYIISFTPGSSGRFIHAVLNDLMHQSEDVIEFNKNNDAHFELAITAFAEDIGVNSLDVFKVATFDSRLVNVLKTHTYPDFDVIRERFGDDVGIILITISLDNLPEIVFNSQLKNEGKILSTDVLKSISKFKQKTWSEFINPTIPNRNNILVLEYDKLFDKNDNGYVTIQLLEQFTGVKSLPILTKTYENYHFGRNRLLETYPWLSELKQNLDK